MFIVLLLLAFKQGLDIRKMMYQDMSDILDIGSSKSKFATHSAAENFMPSPNFMIPAVPNVRKDS